MTQRNSHDRTRNLGFILFAGMLLSIAPRAAMASGCHVDERPRFGVTLPQMGASSPVFSSDRTVGKSSDRLGTPALRRWGRCSEFARRLNPGEARRFSAGTRRPDAGSRRNPAGRGPPDFGPSGRPDPAPEAFRDPRLIASRLPRDRHPPRLGRSPRPHWSAIRGPCALMCDLSPRNSGFGRGVLVCLSVVLAGLRRAHVPGTGRPGPASNRPRDGRSPTPPDSRSPGVPWRPGPARTGPRASSIRPWPPPGSRLRASCGN